MTPSRYQPIPIEEPNEAVFEGVDHPRKKWRSASMVAVVASVVLCFFAVSLVTRSSSRAVVEPCPDYGDYASAPHEPRSQGKHQLPFMRPPERCRTFSSPAVERIVNEMTPRFKDPDLAMLFTNAFTQTLDTTIRWTNDDLAFVVTGDINAEWVRDTYNQVEVYMDLLPKDLALAGLVKKIITLQARYLEEYPFCNSFQAPVESRIEAVHNSAADGAVVEPSYDNSTVFECKFELDSHAGFLALSRRYFEGTNDTAFAFGTGSKWAAAMERILDVLEDETRSTFDDGGFIQSAYNFSSKLDVVVNRGVGPPQKATGLVGTSFRPSDDMVTFRFNIADNAMLAVELEKIATCLQKARPELARRAESIARGILVGITEHGVVDHPKWGRIYAYEVDGYGSRLLMDDANNPSLLSLPLLGFTNLTAELYTATRKMLLSVEGNPYFNRGKYGAAIGSPHTGIQHVWPMSLVTQMLTTANEEEIVHFLETLVSTTSGLGLIHESFNVGNTTQFTRPWFAWANSYFAHGILTLARTHPHVLFKDSASPS